jgi:hypothetical protein
MSRAAQMELVETLPYSLSKAGPAEIDGVGNYYIEVLARGSSGHSAITIYLLDTHSYSPNERKFPGYDWLKKSQIDWFRATAQGLKKKHKEYTHHHFDVAFIHIPLPEYVSPNLTLVGDWKEPSTAPAYNSGFYDALVEEKVVMVSCGQYVNPIQPRHPPSIFLFFLLLTSRCLVTTSTSTAACPPARTASPRSGCATRAPRASAATPATAASTARSASSTST